MENTLHANIKVEKGLKGIYVAETDTSDVNGIEGILTVKGYNIDEIALNASFEEAVYLLLYNKRISNNEFNAYRNRLARYRKILPITEYIIKNCVENDLKATETLQMALSTLFLSWNITNIDKNELIIASFPTIIAYYTRLKIKQDIIEPKTELGHVENFLYMLTGKKPDKLRVRALETYLITVMDHGMNASTFTSRCIASSGSDLLSAVLGAIGSLKGPKHGGAPGPALELVLNVATSDNPELVVRELLEKGEKIPGFGHRIYKTRDPRAAVLQKAGEQFYKDNEPEISKLFMNTEQLILRLLLEYKPGRQLYTNVEFYTAYLLHGIGIEVELFTPLFSMARVVGWLAHADEQIRQDLIIRPSSLYMGEYGKKWNS